MENIRELAELDKKVIKAEGMRKEMIEITLGTINVEKLVAEGERM